MKYLQLKTALCALILLLPAALIAQNTDTDRVAQSIQDSMSNGNQQVVLKDSAAVYTGIQTIQKQDLLGGVSVVDVPQIMQKNYIMSSFEGLQAYVGGFNGNLWGMFDYLVLVDGIPRSAQTVNPSAIKQITFLKGVSATVLYGSRAANGVIQITTKEGGNNDLQVNSRVDAGLYVPKRYPDYLGSGEYMTLYNEALQNDGLSPQYNQETIYNYASGEDPYRYPSVDYYSPQYVSDYSNRYQGNVEISGGDEAARYYSNINFASSSSLLNFGEAKNDRSNQFNIRANVDFDISDKISATVDGAVIYDGDQGINTDYWGQAATLRPDRYTPLIPVSMFGENNANLQDVINNSNYVIDGQYLLGGTQINATNPIASTYAGGSNEYVGRQFQFNTGVNVDLNDLLDGLSFKSLFGVDYQSNYSQAYNNNYAVYQPNWAAYNGNNQVSGLTQYGEDSKTGAQNISNSTFQQTLAFRGQFNYEREINDDQHFSAMLLANVFQISQTGEYHRNGNANLGLQLRYNYQQKYYADFSAAVPHSAQLPEGNRQAFSPTVSLGWRISDEDFMADVESVNNLKLTASAGIIHTDIGISGYRLYESSYNQATGSYFGWRDGLLRRGTQSLRGANPDLTYVKRKEINAGIEGSLFDNTVAFNARYFINQMDGGVVQAGALYPSYFAPFFPETSFIPYVNYNVDQRQGIDFNMNFNKRIGEMNWSLGLAGTYYDSKAVKRAEINQFDYQNREGKPLDGIWGLESTGLFDSQEEIDNYEATQQFGTVRPGDIKYVDQNGDGVINDQDQVYLGKAGYNGAPFTFGLNLTTQWKNFTFFALGTGQFGGKAVKNSDYFWVNGADKYSAIVRDRWTEETKNTASYPRLTTQSGTNNFRTSDFWMYSTDRFDLQKVQVSYNLPANVLRSLSIRDLQVYVSGFNLLTASSNHEIMEMNVGGTPQSRIYNIGVKAKF